MDAIWWIVACSFLAGVLSRRLGFDAWYWGVPFGLAGGAVGLLLAMLWRRFAAAEPPPDATG